MRRAWLVPKALGHPFPSTLLANPGRVDVTGLVHRPPSADWHRRCTSSSSSSVVATNSALVPLVEWPSRLSRCSAVPGDGGREGCPKVRGGLPRVAASVEGCGWKESRGDACSVVLVLCQSSRAALDWLLLAKVSFEDVSDELLLLFICHIRILDRSAVLPSGLFLRALQAASAAFFSACFLVFAGSPVNCIAATSTVQVKTGWCPGPDFLVL